jgi:MscS family membrane protein
MDFSAINRWLTDPFFGIATWVWIAVPLFLLLSFAVAYCAVHGIMWFLEKAFVRARKKEFFKRTIAPLFSPLTWVVASFFFNASNHFLPIEKSQSGFLNRAEIVFHTFAVAWVVMQYLHLLIDGYRRRLIAQERPAAAAMMPLVKKGSNFAVVVLAILFLLQNFGYDITAMLTAAGVGGIAVALASQKSLEGIFGGLSIALDQPVRVGDFGNFDNKVMGTVEDIGLNTCRIRTLGQTVVTIPNTMMNNMIIENFSQRGKFWFKHVVGLRYDTPAATLRQVTSRVQELLEGHPMVDAEPRVRFIAFNSSSLDVEIFAFILVKEIGEFLKVQEELLFAIMEIVQECGADFAFPTQTISLDNWPEQVFSSGDNGQDKARSNGDIRPKLAAKPVSEAERKRRLSTKRA